MLQIRMLERKIIKHTLQQTSYYCKRANQADTDGEFRVLNLRSVKNYRDTKRNDQKRKPISPRSKEMAVDQDWGSVWPGPRTFHPATVPLPLRQGYAEKGAPPDKFANAELMKIPNFLHLTPPVIKRQCEILKQFCTQFPKTLSNDEMCEKHFPLQVLTSDYCHSSPTIRDPMSRIVNITFKLDHLKLNNRAKDKYLRLIGDKYDETTGCVTIVTDRCPTRKQNYDYAMYLITALYHESYNVEPWEKLKSEDDMEFYDWEKSRSKSSIETLFGKSVDEIPESDEYSKAVDNLMNEGESDYTLNNYAESVRKLLNLPQKSVE